MPQVALTAVPKDAVLIEGKRGGLYWMRNGVKVYVAKVQPRRNRRYKKPSGAFARYVDSTMPRCISPDQETVIPDTLPEPS